MKLSNKPKHRAPKPSIISKRVETNHTYINSNGDRITSNPLNNKPFCNHCGGDSGTNGHLIGCKNYDENIHLQLEGNQVVTEAQNSTDLTTPIPTV